MKGSDTNHLPLGPGRYTQEEQARIDNLMDQMEKEADQLREVKKAKDRNATRLHLQRLRGTIVELNNTLDKTGLQTL